MPSKRVVVLTGAGISAESGLSTFRDSGGLWEGFDINEVASIEGWTRNPSKVLDFYNLRREQVSKAEPNPAHKALAKLEEHFEVVIVTQNVDDLHERAGSKNIIHLHGEIIKARSERNEFEITEIGYDPIKMGDFSLDGTQLRPAIVWFGEMVPMIEKAAVEVSKAEILIVVGTSLMVYPAASLIHYCDPHITKYIVDPVTPELSNSKNWNYIENTASDGVPELVHKLITQE